MLYYINWQSFSLIAFTSQDIGQHVYSNVCFPGCDVIKFKINFIFLTELLLYMIKEGRQKFLRTKNFRIKKFLRWNKKRFSLFSKHNRLLKMVLTPKSVQQQRHYFEQIWQIAPMFPLSTLNKSMPAGLDINNKSSFFIFVIYAESVKVSLMI